MTTSAYHFDAEGKLVDQEGAPFKFVDAEHYEKVCEKMTEDVYRMLCEEPCSLKKVNLRGEESISEEDSFVFISQNFCTAKCLVVLINGSGAVRAGQWSRRLIVNESLEVGSQLPYVKKCIQNGWAVLVANTNDNSYRDKYSEEELPKEGSGNAIEHGRNIWARFVVDGSPADKVALVAHSFGGAVVSVIVRSLLGKKSREIRQKFRLGSHENEGNGTKDEQQLRRIRAVCLTDAVYYTELAARLEQRNELALTIRNWKCSEKPLDEELDGVNVSAGTEEHERSSAAAIDSIFRLIVQKFAESE